MRKKNSILLSGPENGEESNITYFIDGPDAVNHLRIQRELPQNCDTVVLCSDGSSVSLLDVETGRIARAVGIIANIVRYLPKEIAEQYINEDLQNLFQKHTHDDVSIAILNFSNPEKGEGATNAPTNTDEKNLYHRSATAIEFPAAPTVCETSKLYTAQTDEAGSISDYPHH